VHIEKVTSEKASFRVVKPTERFGSLVPLMIPAIGHGETLGYRPGRANGEQQGSRRNDEYVTL